jgi:hypothetical protein
MVKFQWSFKFYSPIASLEKTNANSAFATQLKSGAGALGTRTERRKRVKKPTAASAPLTLPKRERKTNGNG